MAERSAGQAEERNENRPEWASRLYVPAFADGLAPRVGLEPTTNRLTADRSAN